jgi:hypothetical protein
MKLPWERRVRYWFASEDGTYYRNCPLVLQEIEETPVGCVRYRGELWAEYDQIWNGYERVRRIDTLGPNDVVVSPAPFSVSHPDMPELSRLLDKDNK